MVQPASIAIVIPARYGSSRFPGKPLAKIGTQTMLQRTCATALAAARVIEQELLKQTSEKITIAIIVATEDQRIIDHCAEINGITSVLTTADCASGSDRALAALMTLALKPEIIINLQGDAPFTPVEFITRIVLALYQQPDYLVATPVVQLSWAALAQLRAHKQKTPFSGTTAIINSKQEAVWFSKTIIPAIRQENDSTYRAKHELSPVYQHIGLYGYRWSALQQFVQLAESHYEQIEGLEQLRFLANNIAIHAEIFTEANHELLAGIDTQIDLQRVESVLAQLGTLD